MAKSDVYLNALRQAGHRITEQRRLICEYLAQSRSHPTPYQVYADLVERNPEISRATVYNTLNVLRELGAVLEIGVGTEHTHYDTDTTPHINLICLRCHTITDYALQDGGPLSAPQVQRHVAASTGFQPAAVKIEVFGFCAACREEKKAEIRRQWIAQQHGKMEEDA
jgi:Fur family peroxide stress response transcriptional regulator